VRTLIAERVPANEWRELPPRTDGRARWFPLEKPGGRETFHVLAERTARRTAELRPKLERLEREDPDLVVPSGAPGGEQAAKPAAAPAPGKAASNPLAEAWMDLRRSVVETLRSDAEEYTYDYKVRAACAVIEAGGDLAKTRDLGAPMPGAEIEIRGENG